LTTISFPGPFYDVGAWQPSVPFSGKINDYSQEKSMIS
jgi:hypothetical protein